MSARARLIVALGTLAVAVAGCGDRDDGAGAVRSSRLVDFTKKPPYVNALDVDPATREFLLTTNRGFFRITRGSGRVRRVRGTVVNDDDGRRATVGTFLELKVTGPGRLVGSGHPDRLGMLPSALGFIRSGDGGRSWRVISRLGDADLHKIVLAHRRMYAFDAVLGALLISRDGGRTFAEHFTPRGLIIDFEVDPADPNRVVASTADQLFRSTDGGATWRPLAPAPGIRLAWPAPGALYRATKDGTVERSADGGDSWRAAGRVDGEPYKFKAIGPEKLYLALSDGTIVHTTNGGRAWRAVFRP